MNLTEKQIRNIVASLRRYAEICYKDSSKQKTAKIKFRPTAESCAQLFREQLQQMNITIASEERANSYNFVADAIVNIATGTWKEMPK